MKHFPGPYEVQFKHSFHDDNPFQDDLTKVFILGPLKDDGWQRYVAEVYVHNMSKVQAKATGKLLAMAPEMLAVLEEITRKSPMKVGRDEAADMACEFWVEANEVLKKLRGEK